MLRTPGVSVHMGTEKDKTRKRFCLPAKVMNTVLLNKRANMGELGNIKATKFHLYPSYWENKFIPTTYLISPYSQPGWTLQEEEHKGNL